MNSEHSSCLERRTENKWQAEFFSSDVIKSLNSALMIITNLSGTFADISLLLHDKYDTLSELILNWINT